MKTANSELNLADIEQTDKLIVTDLRCHKTQVLSIA